MTNHLGKSPFGGVTNLCHCFPSFICMSNLLFGDSLVVVVYGLDQTQSLVVLLEVNVWESHLVLVENNIP